MSSHGIQSNGIALRALVAEDNQVNQKLVTRLLERRGFSTVVVGNGREAVDRLAHESFDVVLMDIQMPEMSGVEATRAIRVREQETGEHVPIIALTANAQEGDRERFLAAGMDEYISKPIDTRRLFEVIESVAYRKGSSPMHAGENETELDREVLLEQFGGDPQFLAEVVDQFGEDLPALLTNIGNAVAEENAALLERSAHSLRGAASNFGAERVVALAAELERAGAEKRAAGCDATARNLVVACDALLKALRTLCRTTPAG